MHYPLPGLAPRPAVHHTFNASLSSQSHFLAFLSYLPHLTLSDHSEHPQATQKEGHRPHNQSFRVPSRALTLPLPVPLRLPGVLHRGWGWGYKVLLPLTPTLLCTFGQSKDKLTPGEGDALASMLLLSDIGDKQERCPHHSSSAEPQPQGGLQRFSGDSGGHICLPHQTPHSGPQTPGPRASPLPSASGSAATGSSDPLKPIAMAETDPWAVQCLLLPVVPARASLRAYILAAPTSLCFCLRRNQVTSWEAGPDLENKDSIDPFFSTFACSTNIY